MNFTEIIKDNKIRNIIIAGLAGAIITTGAVSVSALTAPYALTADGEKVKEPFNVCIDGEPVALVATEEDGNALIDQIKNHYTKKNQEYQKIEVKEELTVEPAVLQEDGKHPKVDDPDEVVDYVFTGTKEKKTYTVKADDTDWDIAQKFGITEKTLQKWNPDIDTEVIHEGDVLNIYEKKALVHVTTVAKVTYTKKINYKTKYIKSSKYYIGERVTKKSGVYGKKKVTAEVTAVNGEVKERDVISSNVVKEPKSAVVVKGTKAKGQSVVDYAMQFLGNPYVYGGSSLTGGTDCSGFTMSVYAHFGYSLPHNSWAQLNCGKAVSYSEAAPGDLIIYGDHVAIYAGGGTIVHASNPSTGITTGSATYRNIVGVRRIIN